MAAACFAIALAFGPDPGVLAGTALITIAIIGLGSLYRISSLAGGGSAVAVQMGGVPVPADTADPHLRRLRNVVEEMSIASGVPVPEVYVLEREAAINAFAAGYSPADAAVAVTRGALDRLNRDELQGVIAHEFSHILNGDMRLNIRLLGVLFGILMLGLVGRRIMLHGGRSRGRGAGGIVIAALVAIVIGYVGLFFGRMIKAGVSRSREVLADASAVQFTRQTSGIAGALKKIAGVREGSRFEQRSEAEEVSHMLFGDGVGLSGLFATHPPILQRIQALEPGFRPEQLERLQAQWRSAPPDGLQEDLRMGLAPGGETVLPEVGAGLTVTPPMVAAQVANPRDDDYRIAGAIVSSLPAALRAQARQRDAAMPLLLGLLLDDGGEVRGHQGSEIAARLGAPVAEAAEAFHAGELSALHPMHRLPLATLAFPVLRMRPKDELEAFIDTVHAVVHTDEHVSLFEYCLGSLVESQLRESLNPGRHRPHGGGKAVNVKREFAILLAVVAQAGHRDPDEARRAYLAALQRVLPRDHLPYTPPERGVLALDEVWGPLDRMDPLAKQLMVEAITAAAMHDGRITVAESELLRTICGVLHCPLPPMLQQG